MTNSPSSASSTNNSRPHPAHASALPFELRVRYSETDQMGIAHNKAYLDWFEIGRTEFCRRQGLTYKAIEERGYYLVVVEAFCRYKKPLRYDEPFVVWTSLREITPKKAAFAYELRTPDKTVLIAEGHTVHIAVNRGGTVTPLPADILEKISAPLGG
jgi:acyl-CoA thioester hydrolase